MGIYFAGLVNIYKTHNFRMEQTCSTVALLNPIMKGSKNSDRLFISPEVTNLKNITTIQ